ncbi:hypothetical protein [Nostoc sp. CMAA1605]|uniref:hypothetical protein n=1 Tax=Nostoc sp. CMAA1605 TaxID=2055159 RepID=UPI001F23D2AE|nr:hypothetical protein [Nostoc sp. CMAA1605]MCF4967290.1 hypothetical protein [Nostoc sp. CMAA1605]
MIHHFSIAAENPQRAATVLAEVLNGQAFPFFPNPGSYMVFPLDEHGTGIEVYPIETELKPGEDEAQCTFAKSPHVSRYTATHAAVSVTTTQEKIEEVGRREGWRVVRCNRDSFFDVMEFWLENRVMIELLTPEMAAQYLAVTKPENLQQMFAAAA